MKQITAFAICLAAILYSCNTDNTRSQKIPAPLKEIKKELPIIGLLIYEGVLTTEVTAPLDVFAKLDANGKQLFNVITIAETPAPITSEEGLTIMPDYTFENSPDLDVIFVPSAYDVQGQLKNKKIIAYIRKQDQNTSHTISNCAGAFLIGEAHIADGKKIVTYIGGGKELQTAYPELKVQNDSLIGYVEDGKFLSSNGNLMSYIPSLELLEKLTDREHRKFVEDQLLYMDRLQQWEK